MCVCVLRGSSRKTKIILRRVFRLNTSEIEDRRRKNAMHINFNRLFRDVPPVSRRSRTSKRGNYMLFMSLCLYFASIHAGNNLKCTFNNRQRLFHAYHNSSVEKIHFRV